MRTSFRLLVALAILACAPACAVGTYGLLFSHVTVPLDLDVSDTSLSETQAADDTKHFSWYVRVEWDSRGIGDIARRYRIDRAHHADLEVLSVMGVWTQRHVHLYGPPRAP